MRLSGACCAALKARDDRVGDRVHLAPVGVDDEVGDRSVERIAHLP